MVIIQLIIYGDNHLMHYPISSGASIISDYWRSGSHFESGYSNVTRSHRMHTRDTWTP